MNLPRISLTKNRGCSSLTFVGPVTELRALDHGRFHKTRDQDPFADKNAIADYHCKTDAFRLTPLFFTLCTTQNVRNDVAVRQFSSMTQLPTTPLKRRLACWLYEGVLLFGVVFIVDYAFSALTQTRNALNNRHAQQILLFLVLGLYFTWQWRRTGQTLPMKTWHIRLITRDGSPLSWQRAVLRYVLAWLWFLPPLVAAWVFKLDAPSSSVLVLGWIPTWAILARFHPDTQFWHDAWSGTRLVSIPRTPEAVKP